jgi:hypothetical protein
MFYVDALCTICRGYSQVGFWKCSDGSLVLLCDECSAVWPSPTEVTPDAVLYPNNPPFKIDDTRSLWGTNTGWANRDDVEAADWASLIAGEAPHQLRRKS